MKKSLYVLLLTIAIAGCDVNLNEVLYLEAPYVPIVMENGIELQISDTQKASITGRDQCPDNRAQSSGCILLSGKDSVTVSIQVDGEAPFEENWVVEEDDDGKKVRLFRPNGWAVYKPGLQD